MRPSWYPDHRPQGCVAALCSQTRPSCCLRDSAGGEGHGPFSGDHQQTPSLPSPQIVLLLLAPLRANFRYRPGEGVVRQRFL